MNPPTSQAFYLDVAIGAVIENRRRKKKLTQQQLSAKTQISQPRLSRIEAGKSLTFAEYRALEAVLGKRIEDDAREIVALARKGSGAISTKRVSIGTEELIPIVARRWT